MRYVLILVLALTLLVFCPAISLILFLTYNGSSHLLYNFYPIFGASVVGAIVIGLVFTARAPRDYVLPRVGIAMGVGFTLISFFSSLNFLNLFWTFNHTTSWIGRVPFLYLHLCCFIQYCALSSCKLRSRTYLYLISYPCSIFFSTMIFSLPLLPFTPLLPTPAPQVLFFLPLLLACFGLYQTLETRHPRDYEFVNITVAPQSIRPLARTVSRLKPSAPDSETSEAPDRYKPPLRIVQITDPHLGPIMSVARLRTICQNAVELKPDLILLTGDFFTIEAYIAPNNTLAEALAPLAAYPSRYSGKTFACLGNHDKEGKAEELVKIGLREVGAQLLVDESVVVNTSIGELQIVGLDWKRKGAEEHVKTVCKAHPPIPDNALVLSGHTHGGSVGLLTLGIRASIVGLIGMPDNGLWTHKSNYLYVHRGQGCRSMMGAMLLRLGIPTEDSVLHVYYM